MAPWDPLNTKKCSITIHMFGLCENAWLPWQPVMRILKMGLYLKNQLYLGSILNWYHIKKNLVTGLLTCGQMFKLLILHMH